MRWDHRHSSQCGLWYLLVSYHTVLAVPLVLTMTHLTDGLNKRTLINTRIITSFYHFGRYECSSDPEAESMDSHTGIDIKP
jgi:hypothetical protein